MRVTGLTCLVRVMRVLSDFRVARLDREGLGFKRHVHSVHNKWMYVAFWMHLLEKQKEDFNGQESYMYAQLKSGDLSIFPSGVATELSVEEA